MNETILDKGTYQTDRWRMCWVTLEMNMRLHGYHNFYPAREAKANSISMAQYLALK